MKYAHAFAIAAAIVLGSTPTSAQQNPSQHPRVGQLAELTFAPGSAQLATSANRKLGTIAAWAHENPDGMIVIDGHADRTVSAKRRVHVSLARAQAVREKLVGLGVDADQVVIAAYDRRGPERRVVVWGTHRGLKAVIARTMARGHAVIWTNGMPELEENAIATREAGAARR